MKKIFAIVFFLVAFARIADAQSSFTQTFADGITTIQGNYWFFIYDTLVVTQPVEITGGQTQTKQSVFAANSEQDCYDKILILFGQAEVDRVKALNKPIEPEIPVGQELIVPPPPPGD